MFNPLAAMSMLTNLKKGCFVHVRLQDDGLIVTMHNPDGKALDPVLITGKKLEPPPIDATDPGEGRR